MYFRLKQERGESALILILLLDFKLFQYSTDLPNKTLECVILPLYLRRLFDLQIQLQQNISTDHIHMSETLFLFNKNCLFNKRCNYYLLQNYEV